MADLFADENLSYDAVYVLRSLGHTVLTAREAGLAGSPDQVILAEAIKRGRAVVTENRTDFMRLHRQSDNHEGIIVCTRDRDHDRLGKRIDAVIRANLPLARKLLRVVRPG